MILIADSGSTKTAWVGISPQRKNQFFQCKGLNPITVPAAQISKEVLHTFRDAGLKTTISKLFFYGAGCWNEETCQIIKNVLSTIFPNAEIVVDSDLVGAIKATCGQQAGITCILGTGSNSCLYNGEQIVDAIPSLGYQLGDEGSGAYLGKQLLKHYFYRELPDDLNDYFQQEYALHKQEVIQKVYREPGANRYLASFALFLNRYKEHPYVRNLLKKSFEDFLVRHVFKYTQYHALPIHFVGSIAYHFQTSLKVCLQEYNLQIGSILETPIEGLARHYSNKI